MLQGFRETLRWYLSLEKNRLSRYLRQHFGYYLLLFGNMDLSWVETSPVLMKACVKSQHDSSLMGVVAKSDALPFFPDSIDVMVFVRELSQVENPRAALQEVYSVLRHDGVVIISELNPYRPWARSFWRWSKKHQKNKTGRMLSWRQTQILLESVGFELVSEERLGVFKNSTSEKKLWGRWLVYLFPWWSMGYLLIAKKKTIAITPIKFQVKEKLLIPEIETERA